MNWSWQVGCVIKLGWTSFDRAVKDWPMRALTDAYASRMPDYGPYLRRHSPGLGWAGITSTAIPINGGPWVVSTPRSPVLAPAHSLASQLKPNLSSLRGSELQNVPAKLTPSFSLQFGVGMFTIELAEIMTEGWYVRMSFPRVDTHFFLCIPAVHAPHDKVDPWNWSLRMLV